MAPSHPFTAVLTDVESDVLDWLARGYSYEETARLLGITPGTVRLHERAICDKLHVGSRPEAVREAVRYGWLVG